MSPDVVSRTLKQTMIHPEFDFWTLENDIGLLRLSAPVTFTPYIQPICLASTNSAFHSGISSWVTGFGATGKQHVLFFVQYYCWFIWKDFNTKNLFLWPLQIRCWVFSQRFAGGQCTNSRKQRVQMLLWIQWDRRHHDLCRAQRWREGFVLCEYPFLFICYIMESRLL